MLNVTVRGSDVIFLGGRTDITIPPAVRRGILPPACNATGSTSEEIRETFPPFLGVVGGDIIRLAGSFDRRHPAVSTGSAGPTSAPRATTPTRLGSSCRATSRRSGGISGYFGPEGSVGCLPRRQLDNCQTECQWRARAPQPGSTTGLGRNFLTLTPGLGQIFYIGNGVTTSVAVFQEFIAPVGATRLFLGSRTASASMACRCLRRQRWAYQVRIGVNEVPTVPEPGVLALLGLGLVGLPPRPAHCFKVKVPSGLSAPPRHGFADERPSEASGFLDLGPDIDRFRRVAARPSPGCGRPAWLGASSRRRRASLRISRLLSPSKPGGSMPALKVITIFCISAIEELRGLSLRYAAAGGRAPVGRRCRRSRAAG